MRFFPLLFFAALSTTQIAAGEEPLPLPSEATVAALADKCELIVVGTLTEYWGGPGSADTRNVNREDPSTVWFQNSGAVRIHAVLKGAKPESNSLPILLPSRVEILPLRGDLPPKRNAAGALMPGRYIGQDRVGGSYVFFLRPAGGVRMTTADKTGKQIEDAVFLWKTADGNRPLYPNDPKLIEALKKYLGKP
jgi:hypothetical protein